jgi:hypothetical protein
VETEATLKAERDRAERAEAALRSERARAEEAEAAAQTLRAVDEQLAAERATLGEAQRHLSAAQNRVRQLESELNGAHAQLGAARTELEEARAEALSAQAELEAASAKSRSVEPHGGPGWGAVAQRELAAALARASDWRLGVKAAIGVLGSAGGWDAICAWQPDERREYASCFTTWIAHPDWRSEFETATWQRRQPLSTSGVGQGFASPESRWLRTDPDSEDSRLRALAHQGMGSALVVPVRFGAGPVAVLELITAAAGPPTAELIAAIEAVALQLGHFWHLLSVGAQPVWRFGRV